MKADKIITNTPELSFERFKDAVRHIISVPKSKAVAMENKNSHIPKGSRVRNGRSD
jgi:hypothetical protein